MEQNVIASGFYDLDWFDFVESLDTLDIYAKDGVYYAVTAQIGGDFPAPIIFGDYEMSFKFETSKDFSFGTPRVYRSVSTKIGMRRKFIVPSVLFTHMTRWQLSPSGQWVAGASNSPFYWNGKASLMIFDQWRTMKSFDTAMQVSKQTEQDSVFKYDGHPCIAGHIREAGIYRSQGWNTPQLFGNADKRWRLFGDSKALESVPEGLYEQSLERLNLVDCPYLEGYARLCEHE